MESSSPAEASESSDLGLRALRVLAASSEAAAEDATQLLREDLSWLEAAGVALGVCQDQSEQRILEWSLQQVILMIWACLQTGVLQAPSSLPPAIASRITPVLLNKISAGGPEWLKSVIIANRDETQFVLRGLDGQMTYTQSDASVGSMLRNGPVLWVSCMGVGLLWQFLLFLRCDAYFMDSRNKCAR